MIDRGDLSAEVGNEKLYDAIIKISKASKKFGKSLIMATENLDSMMTRKSPTKSEIVSLGFSLSINADKIMLSDETATSKNWYFVIKWLDKYLNEKKILKIQDNSNEEVFWKMISNLPSKIPVVIFSRRGIAIEKLSTINKKINLIVFTDNLKTSTICSFKSYAKAIIIKKFDETKKNDYIYKTLKNYKKDIFKNNNTAVVIYISYPRKNSRANTIALVDKKDFE